jgi:hypothetical protein
MWRNVMVTSLKVKEFKLFGLLVGCVCLTARVRQMVNCSEGDQSQIKLALPQIPLVATTSKTLGRLRYTPLTLPQIIRCLADVSAPVADAAAHLQRKSR